MINKNKGSVEGGKHPYMKLDFWLNTNNHWWESDMIGNKTKERYRKMVEKLADEKLKLNLL